MDINLTSENLPIIKALANETRINILSLLKERPLNGTQISHLLDLSPSIINRHLKQLEEAKVIRLQYIEGTERKQKYYIIAIDELRITFPIRIYEKYQKKIIDISVGSFSNFKAKPTCGLASDEGYIGVLDEPKYFMVPERINAQLLWLSSGFIEYNFFNPVTSSSKVHLIEISFEIASEFPGSNYVWPSDIDFLFNNVNIGTWTSPGNYADVRGHYTPSWWPDSNSQYGQLKTIRITPEETQIDGEKISNFKLSNINFDLTFFTLRFSNTEKNLNNGGITLFGEKFGNYSQNIRVTVYYND
ncbi:ArsR family transcriptional regulator [Aerococcaceae bacterium INB8]|uniref:ArsR family transcriptional regulator n=1 Tax=Ruoffia halotolerans TaxID=2748684 RepID=A0A839A3R0_9LACT|nr:ArsR family transcriptional regulator [Ruoffia halotolerans]MBA5728428.1 ArsR family transcriptional regulator [Ruoffia halotolerans]